VVVDRVATDGVDVAVERSASDHRSCSCTGSCATAACGGNSTTFDTSSSSWRGTPDRAIRTFAAATS
jgi:hypothetical protein